MKKPHLLAVFMLLLFGCHKEFTDSNANDKNLSANYLEYVQSQLKDSLLPTDYNTLDFSHSITSWIDSLHIKFLRVPITGKPIESIFLVVETDDTGHVIKGRFINVAKDTADKASFTGTIQYRGMKGQIIKAARMVKGKLYKVGAGNASSLKEEDPVIDGGDLPPVIVSYTDYGSGCISYADWYNLLDMAGDGGGGYSGYYSPAYGGGGGGGAPVEQVDFEPEGNAAISLEQYLKCFGTIPDAGATYTLGIYTDIPVNNDPGKIFNWQTGAVGHSFITLTKHVGVNSVQQSIGFYPETGWKSIEANDPVTSKPEDNAGHEFNASLIVNIDAAHFGAVMTEMRYQSTSRYDIDQFNCTDFALAAFNAGAPLVLSIPQYHLPGSMDGQVSNTPNGLYEELVRLNSSGGYYGGEITVPGVAGFVGGSHGPCN